MDNVKTSFNEAEFIKKLEMLYEELLLKIEDYPDSLNETTGTAVTFNDFYNSLTKWIGNNEYVLAAIDAFDETGYSFRVQYETWYDLMNPVEEE